jgi:hypothetical protein
MGPSLRLDGGSEEFFQSLKSRDNHFGQFNESEVSSDIVMNGFLIPFLKSYSIIVNAEQRMTLSGPAETL